MSDMRGSTSHMMGGPAWECMNPYCSRNRSSYSSGSSGSDWLYKDCATPGCSNQVRYKSHWDNPPNYCDSCKEQHRNSPRAGSLQRRKDGGYNEYHGRGHHNSEGGIDFDDSQGKHSHTVRDKDFNKVWERKEGES